MACEKESKEEIVEFVEPKPSAAFSYSVPSEADPFTISFKNESKNFSISRWSFADDSTSSDASPTHTFLGTGTYNVKLFVLNGEDYWAQREEVIKIIPSQLVNLEAQKNGDGSLTLKYTTKMTVGETIWQRRISSTATEVVSNDATTKVVVPPGTFQSFILNVITPKGSLTQIPVMLTDVGVVKDITNFDNNFTVSKENNSGKESGEGSLKVIDNNIDSKFFVGDLVSPGIVWLQFEYFEPQVVRAYTMTSGNDADARDPKDWKMLGSQDGVTWVDLDVKTAQPPFPGRKLSQTYLFSNSVAYKYYRLSITSLQSGTAFQLGELRLLQIPD
ncbi:hypothetical protein C4F49_01080 [Sphingobacterium sp. KB22]|uniref:PKD domain-containing protein n=2 Tax=Sphingobacterium hungaricum TaxID=2082723 RepID=A0A928YPA8_9SPHI|nr:hypothetical protein [Sphingobacterium hungaricum]